MAKLNDIGAVPFTRFGVKGAQGSGNSMKYLEIPHARGEPDVGSDGSTYSIPGYGSKHKKKGSGQSDIPDFELEVNYNPAAGVQEILKHCSGFLQDAGKKTATATQSGSGTQPTQTFKVGQILEFVVEMAAVDGGDSATFTFKASVSSFKFAPNAETEVIAVIVLAVTDMPIGPSGTAVVFDTAATVSFA